MLRQDTHQAVVASSSVWRPGLAPARVGRGAEALEARVAQNLQRRARRESPNILPSCWIVGNLSGTAGRVQIGSQLQILSPGCLQRATRLVLSIFSYREIMRDKEQIMDGKTRKQSVMDELLVPPSKQWVKYSVIVLKSGSKEVDNEDSVCLLCLGSALPDRDRPEAPRRRGAEAPSRSFQCEARGASRGSAARRASANPGTGLTLYGGGSA